MGLVRQKTGGSAVEVQWVAAMLWCGASTLDPSLRSGYSALRDRPEERCMRSVNVDDLPEPVAQALAHLVETLKEQFRAAPKPRERVELAVRKGTVIGDLSRQDIYRGVGRMGADDTSEE